MPTQYTRPRVGDIVYALYDRPLHPELFTALAVRIIHRPQFTLAIRITPTGHVFSWAGRGGAFTEVTTAADAELPAGHRLVYRKLRGEQTDAVRGRGLTYQVTRHVEVLPPEQFFHVHDELLADGAKRGLLAHFPPASRLAVTPLGLLTSEPGPNRLMLGSCHTFPDEYAVVVTQALIEYA